MAETPTQLIWARTPEVAEAVLDRYERGEMVTVICRDYGVSHGRWYDWLDEDADLAHRFRKATDRHHRAFAEAAIEIVEELPMATHVLNKDKTAVISSRVDSGYVTWQRTRYDARMRSLAKWDAANYGDRAALDLGSQPGQPIEVKSTGPAELTVKLSAMLRAAKREDEKLLKDAEEFL